MANAIVVGSHSIGYGIIRSLGEKNIPVIVIYYSDKDMGFVSKYVTKAFKVPNPDKNELEFISELNRICEQFKDSILFPSDDVSLAAISRHKDSIPDSISVACQDWEIIKKIIDKKYTYEAAAQIGIPAPKTVAVSNLNEIDAIKDDINYPCLIKPRESHKFADKFDCKVFKVNNFDELNKYFCLADKSNLQVLVQEFIPGPDTLSVNYNSFNFDNISFVEFTAHKVRLAHPRFGIPRCVKSAVIPEIIEAGRNIVKAIGYKGYSCTEFKKDPRDGIFKLMEINGRHNRSGLLALKCGINFPYIEYLFLSQGKISEYKTFRENVFWIDEFHDFFSTIKYFKIEDYSFIEYIRPYLGPKIFSVFNSKDLAPFMQRTRNLVKQLSKRISPFKLRPIKEPIK